MSRAVPTDIKLYHIVHLDRLSSIIQDGFIWSDAEVQQRRSSGTTIGMSSIKERRMHNALTCYPDLHVGECVPFYFCPRSIMLYLLYMNNHPDVTYTGGQEPIIHFVVDLLELIESIGVYSINQQQSVAGFLSSSGYKPPVNVMKNWYY